MPHALCVLIAVTMTIDVRKPTPLIFNLIYYMTHYDLGFVDHFVTINHKLQRLEAVRYNYSGVKSTFSSGVDV